MPKAISKMKKKSKLYDYNLTPRTRKFIKRIALPCFLLFSWPVIIFHDTYHSRQEDDGYLRKLQNQVPDACYQNFIRNSDFEMSDGSTPYWVGDTAWNDYKIVDHGTGNALAISDRYRINEGVRQNLRSFRYCLEGSDFYFRIQAKVRFYDKATGEGVMSCVNDKLVLDGVYTIYNCPVITIITKRSDQTVNDSYQVHDVNLKWDPNGWNQIDIIYKVPVQQTGPNINKFLILFWGGPIDAVYLIDDVVVHRMELEDLPDGHPIYNPEPPACEVNILQNGDGYYQSPFSWDAYGHWASEIEIDAIPSDVDPSNYILVATDRVDPLNEGLSQFVSSEITDCLKGYQYYLRLQASVKLSDTPTQSCVTSCTLDTPNDCPHLRVDIRKKGEGTGVAHFYDYDMISNWKCDEWNNMDMIFSPSPDMSHPEVEFMRVIFVGGPASADLKLDNAVMKRLVYKELPADKYINTFDGVLRNPPIKECTSYGDPHIKTFAGNKFDDLENGWKLLYSMDGLQVESRQTEWYDTGATYNDAVRITYQTIVYEYTLGELPSTSNPYYNADDQKLHFSVPPVKVYISVLSISSQHLYTVFISSFETRGAVGLCADEVFAEEMSAAQQTFTFDPSAPSEEDAKLQCSQLEGTDTYESCVFDVRAVNDPVVATRFVEISQEVLTTSRELEQESEEAAILSMAGPDQQVATFERMPVPVSAAVSGDPIIIGLKNQVFKFDGKNDAWYANLATDTFQWNMKFHKFSQCPKSEDMFISGMTFSIYDESEFPRIDSMDKRTAKHAIGVMVRNEDSYFPGCDKNSFHCLGFGSLAITLNDDIITMPGKYSSSSGRDQEVTVIAYNTFGACSRRCFDCLQNEEDKIFEHGRRLSLDKRPIDYLLEADGDRRDSNVCRKWIEKRAVNDDLFQQAGGWSTIHIETPLVSIHVEYRQSQGGDGSCPSHSLDAWMSHVSLEMHNQDWQGILGETRLRKFDSEGGQIKSDRSRLLIGKEDNDYEVMGAYGSDFKVRRFRRHFGLSTVGMETLKRFLIRED